MAHYEPDMRDTRVFTPTSVPNFTRVGLYLCDRDEGQPPRPLWFQFGRVRVPFELTDIIALWAPGPIRLKGRLGMWPHEPQLSKLAFTLGYTATKKRGRRVFVPELTVYGVTPLCPECGSHTNRHDWQLECPNSACGTVIEDPNKPSDPTPNTHCMRCGVVWVQAGSRETCPQCGDIRQVLPT